jgi:hypothetical protein
MPAGQGFSGNSLDQGEIFSVTRGTFSQAFHISYSADGGNDVALIAVPERASAAILFCGATLLVARRRRS